MNRKKETNKEQGKRERVPNHACAHRDDRLLVVIASSGQTARITRSDARRPTPPLPPPLPCMVYVVCRVVWCTSCIIPQRRGTSIQSSCWVCWVEEKKSSCRIHLSRREKKTQREGINLSPYPYPPPSPSHPTSSRSTTLSWHLPSLLQLPLPLPPLPRPPHAR